MHFAKYTAKTSSNKVTVCLILVIFKYTYKFQFVDHSALQMLGSNKQRKRLGVPTNTKAFLAEGVGFEPTCLTANGFQDFVAIWNLMELNDRKAPDFGKQI